MHFGRWIVPATAAMTADGTVVVRGEGSRVSSSVVVDDNVEV